MLCWLTAHDVGLNLWRQLDPEEIPVAVGIVEPMHSSLLPLCRTHHRARSEAQICWVHLPCQDYGWHTINGEWSVYLIRKGHCNTETGAFPQWSSFLLTYKSQGTLFIFLQSSHTLETRIWQLHDWRNPWTAIWRYDVRVQHCGGQHGEETTRSLVCPQPEWNPLHHHLISKVIQFTLRKCWGILINNC